MRHQSHLTLADRRHREAGALRRRKYWGLLITNNYSVSVNNSDRETVESVEWIPTHREFPREVWIGWYLVELTRTEALWPEAAGCCPHGRRKRRLLLSPT